ncbi:MULTISPECIES: DJ-1/PfpI family protein [unclassified Paenibacillus]|uniref:DJ-1/PfpI family protein n=1 Tax=unclassified Paenibacillus TaxID=185978 RepID=UPI003636DD37
MNIQVVLFEGFDLLDVVAPYEVFVTASQITNEEINVRYVSVDGHNLMRSGVNNYPMAVEEKLDLSKKGIILLPGAAGSLIEGDPDSIPMKLKNASETELGELIKKAINDPEILVTSVCGGSMLMAMTGVLEGRNVVTHHMGMDLLSASGANAVHARVVDDGDLITGAGVTSGLDLAIYVVEREYGPRIAHEVEKLFQYEKRGTVWKNSGALPVDYHSNTGEDEVESNHQMGASNKHQSEIDGIWKVEISTAIGKIHVTYDLKVRDNKLHGTATTVDDETDVSILEDTEIIGNRLKWKQQVKKPMKLNLNFDVTINGNTLEGKAKTGMISSKLSGKRVSP